MTEEDTESEDSKLRAVQQSNNTNTNLSRVTGDFRACLPSLVLARQVSQRRIAIIAYFADITVLITN